MQVGEVWTIVRAELASFREEPSQAPVGVQRANTRAELEVGRLRDALVEPHLATVRIGKPTSGPDVPSEMRELWIVTRPVENGYLVVFDPESREFGLAFAGREFPETVAIWGDLVSTFQAR